MENIEEIFWDTEDSPCWENAGFQDIWSIIIITYFPKFYSHFLFEDIWKCLRGHYIHIPQLKIKMSPKMQTFVYLKIMLDAITA